MTSSDNLLKVGLIHAESRDKLKLPVLKVSCTEGCDACCHRPLAVPLIEARVRVKAMLEAPVPRSLWKTVEKRAREDFRVLPALAMLSRLPCVFLKNHRCSIYAHRPLVCRSHYVTSKPIHCDPQGLGRGVTPIATPASDAITEEMIRRGKEMGWILPNLPLPVAYHVAYLLETDQLTEEGVTDYVSKLFLRDS